MCAFVLFAAPVYPLLCNSAVPRSSWKVSIARGQRREPGARSTSADMFLPAVAIATLERTADFRALIADCVEPLKHELWRVGNNRSGTARLLYGTTSPFYRRKGDGSMLGLRSCDRMECRVLVVLLLVVETDRTLGLGFWRL